MGTNWESRSTARAYLESSVHKDGDDLRTLAEWAGSPESVLDVGSGPGHAANAVRTSSTRIAVIFDRSFSMLELGTEHFDNLIPVVGESHLLPFPRSSFEVVTCRVAAHHFPHPNRFLREVHSVLASGGDLLFEDNVAPGDSRVDDFYNTLETLRDPSHVRCHTAEEWKGFMESAGFTVREVWRHDKTLDFDSWLNRMNPTEQTREEIEDLIEDAPGDVLEQLDITTREGNPESFSPETVLIRATRTD